MIDSQNTLLEFYKTTLDYRAQVISIIFVSGVAVAIPNIVTYFDNNEKAKNEIARIEQERDLKAKEIQIKELELKLATAEKHQNYIGQFINQAMDKDIDVRIRFAEYFATLSDEPERWQHFLAKLLEKREDFDKKVETLAIEQRKETADDTKLATLASEINKLGGQIHSTTNQGISPSRDRALSQLRRPSFGRLEELFGRPVKEAKDQGCQSPDNEHFRELLHTEAIGNSPVTLIRPAIDSLKRVLDQIEQDDPALRKSIGFGSESALCVKNEKGTTRLTSHSFGTAIDLTIDGQLVPIGHSGTPEVAQKLGRIAQYLEHAGWVWGGRDVRVEPGHFDVGSELLDQWVEAGTLRAGNQNTRAANR